MKFALRIVTLTTVLMMFFSVASAQAPLDGTYKSVDILPGGIDCARSSHSWTSSPNGRLAAGNVYHARSVDICTVGPASFTNQWEIDCPVVIVAPVLLLDLKDAGGNGQEIWALTYAGGTMFLDGAGPWGGGDPSYSVVLDQFTEIRTLQFVAFNLTGANSNISGSGQVVGYPDACVVLGQANDVLVDDTDSMPKPADYPGFLNQFTCAGSGSIGRWGLVTGVTLDIAGCVVPVESSTWGAVKSIYKE